MKKLGLVLIAVAVLAALAGCGGGTPTPPVKTLINLDKLVTVNMTVSQVYALMTPALKATSILYQADSITQTAKGNWSVTTKQGGYGAGETGPYQALLFTPAKSGQDYYAVFFKADAVIAKSWFSPQGGVVIEAILQGKLGQ